MVLNVFPLSAERKIKEFDVFNELVYSLEKNHEELQAGDVLVISTKYVSNSQGRIIVENKIKVSTEGEKISKKFQVRAEIAELVLRESDTIYGGIPGFVIASSKNIMAPNAGIDRSNALNGNLILYPNNPYLVAEQIRRKVFLKFSKQIGVILVDSRLMPLRIGTSGVAISTAGIDPVLDLRGEKDIFGNLLKVTFVAVADNLATIANYQMGEGTQVKPFAIVRRSGAKLTSKKINLKETTVPPEQCFYVRGLTKSKSLPL